MNNLITFQKLENKKQIIITHSYDHPIKTIWDAYTKTEILEQWWAPKPYKAIVVCNYFENDGQLFYYMLSPKGEKHYCIVEFSNIVQHQSYDLIDAFADANGTINIAVPRMKWENKFTFQNGTTTVTNTINFEKIEDMHQLLAMQFEEGYAMGLNQLFELLNK
jgi:uncharacterized protein YndB with AHSA1/START domain